MPSLYSVCPVIVLFYTVENRSGVFNLASLAIMLGIWFAAAYISHHYVLDVLDGIATALVGITLRRRRLAKSAAFNRFLAALIRAAARAVRGPGPQRPAWGAEIPPGRRTLRRRSTLEQVVGYGRLFIHESF